MTLFASGNSVTSARLIPCGQALRMNPAVRDPIPHYMLMLDKVRRMAPQFDVLHFHIDQLHFPLFRALADKTLTTLHGRQDIPDLKRLYDGFPEMPLVSISDAQRQPVSGANFVGNIPHGIPRDLLMGSLIARGGYLAFLGRISQEKRVDRAIAIARTLGLPLKIAAKIDPVDAQYFREEIAPLFLQPGIEFIGEIDEVQKCKFLGEAQALLFPIDWPEPFGLVMIEAMACGTPVLAFRQGSVDEVVEDGVTGYVVDGLEDAICRVGSLCSLWIVGASGAVSEQRFSAERMAQDYAGIYETLLSALVNRSDHRAAPRCRRQQPQMRKTSRGHGLDSTGSGFRRNAPA